MSRDFFKILAVACGLTGVAFLLVVTTYTVRRWTIPKPFGIRIVLPAIEDLPDDPNLSEDDKQRLADHRATIQKAKREIVSLSGEISGTGGYRPAIESIETEIAQWETKQKKAEREMARIRARVTENAASK